jgi:hypothetical protein
MNRFAFFMCFGVGSLVFTSAALSAEIKAPKKQRLHIVVDADGNVEITPAKDSAQKSDKKLDITCERVRFVPPKKGQSSIEMNFIGAVRMVSGNSHTEAKQMTLSIPDGVKIMLNMKGIFGIGK